MATAIEGHPWLIRTGLLGMAGMLALGGLAANAAHEDLEFPAAIHAGTC